MLFQVHKTRKEYSDTLDKDENEVVLPPCKGAKSITVSTTFTMKGTNGKERVTRSYKADVIELETLEDIVQFVRKNGKCVIEYDSTSDVPASLEIYNGWRE